MNTRTDPMAIVELTINGMTYFLRHHYYMSAVKEPYFSYLRLQEMSDFVLDHSKPDAPFFVKARSIGAIEPTAKAVRDYMSPSGMV